MEDEESLKTSSKNWDSKFSNHVAIQTPAQQRAFSNDLILRKIVSYMSPSTVLKLRPLSKNFESEATSFLLSDKRAQQAFQVKFSWESSGSLIEHGHFEHLYMGTLSEFVENCWSTSRQFPVCNFSFDDGCLATKDVVDFFTKVGSQVKGLGLKMSHQDSTSIEVFARILYEWTPNLQHLDLVTTTWSPDKSLFEGTKLEPDQRVLSSLQTLTLKGKRSTFSTGVVHDILKTAPNLQLICDPQLKITQLLVACQKIHLIPNTFTWTLGLNYPGGQENSQFFAFADARPSHLRTINLSFGPTGCALDTTPEMGTALSNILQSNCESLEKIEQLPFLQCIENVQPLPVFEKVKLLRFYQGIRILNPGPSGMLPPGDTLQGVFPHLKILGLYQLHESINLNPLFQQSEAHRHDGVTTLELDSKFDTFVQDSWIYRSALLYPNVTTIKVRIQDLGTLPDICRAIWTNFDHLEHLRLKLDDTLNTNSLGAKLPGQMDAAMTGIPLQLCKQLWRKLKLQGPNSPAVKDMSGANGDRLRSNPSILNLGRLKTFNIESQCLENYEDVFTSVSTQFAFKPMLERQNLEITFRFSGLKSQTKCIVIDERFLTQN